MIENDFYLACKPGTQNFCHTSTHVLVIGSSIYASVMLTAPRPLHVLETRTARLVRRNRGRVEQARPSNDRLRCNQSSSSSREVRQGSAVAPETVFQMLGRRNPARRPIRCRSPISWSIELHQGFPWRQDMVGSNEAHRHREQEARSNQARRCRRWNVEEPASGTDHQAKDQSDDGSRHNTALLRTRSNRNRNPICTADAKCENAIG
jgi:hypothetical protein